MIFKMDIKKAQIARIVFIDFTMEESIGAYFYAMTPLSTIITFIASFIDVIVSQLINKVSLVPHVFILANRHICYRDSNAAESIYVALTEFYFCFLSPFILSWHSCWTTKLKIPFYLIS